MVELNAASEAVKGFIPAQLIPMTHFREDGKAVLLLDESVVKDGSVNDALPVLMQFQWAKLKEGRYSVTLQAKWFLGATSKKVAKVSYKLAQPFGEKSSGTPYELKAEISLEEAQALLPAEDHPKLEAWVKRHATESGNKETYRLKPGEDFVFLWELKGIISNSRSAKGVEKVIAESYRLAGGNLELAKCYGTSANEKLTHPLLAGRNLKVTAAAAPDAVEEPSTTEGDEQETVPSDDEF